MRWWKTSKKYRISIFTQKKWKAKTLPTSKKLTQVGSPPPSKAQRSSYHITINVIFSATAFALKDIFQLIFSFILHTLHSVLFYRLPMVQSISLLHLQQCLQFSFFFIYMLFDVTAYYVCYFTLLLFRNSNCIFSKIFLCFVLQNTVLKIGQTTILKIALIRNNDFQINMQEQAHEALYQQ